MSKRLPIVVALLLALVTGGTLSAQDSLSQQVLRLLVRDNEWTGVQTFDRAVGLTLESGSVAPSTTTNRLYNVGGNLFFNGVLVATSAGAGTVTSVALTVPSILSVAGSPITSSGTLAVTLATQTANLVFASPGSGGAATPTFRALVTADLPATSAGNLSGTVPVANGGTNLTAGTSGGILGFTATGTIASSTALTANALVVGGGAGAVPTVVASTGTSTTLLHGNAAGPPTWSAVSLTADVTGTLPVTSGGLGIATGTSGGVPYFSAATTIASSAALTANRLVLGGGAGVAPTIAASLGTTTTVLHGNAAGAPTFGAVVLTTDVSGTLPVANGGIGAATLTGVAIGNGTSAVTAATSSTVGQILRTTGANTFAWGAVNLADTDAITGTLPAGNGGTSVTTTPTNGQLLIGNGTGYTLATLTGTANQIVVTGGAGSITLSTPQAIGTASTPQFVRLGLGTGAGATAVITTAGQVNLGIFDDGSCGAADTVDWNAGQVHKIALSAATCTLTLSNPISGAITYELAVAQDITGSRLVTWPASILWAGAGAPTLSTGASDIDYIFLKWNGTNYLGWYQLGID